jgi:acyl-CoA synthetase (AMP-forming)/AMP-acid ligase II
VIGSLWQVRTHPSAISPESSASFTIIAAFGLLTAGGVLVPLNTRFKAAEAGDIIRRSQATLLLVRKNFLGLDFDFKDGKADIPVIDRKSDFLASGTPTELPFRSIMTGYGLTEAGTITASRQGDRRPQEGHVHRRRLGQVGKAFVVRRQNQGGEDVTTEELIDWVPRPRWRASKHQETSNSSTHCRATPPEKS